MTSASPMYYYRSVKSITLTQLLILAILLSSSNAGLAAPTEGEPCTIQKLPGRCTASSKCTTLKPAISSGQIKQNDIPSCGLNAYEEVICCPIIATIATMSLPEERPAVRACREIEKNAGIAIEPHVKDGIPAEPGEFPHVAALGYPGIGSERYAFRCGASLIAPRFLLTATHCIHSPSEEETPIIVRLGTVNIRNVESTVVDMDIKELYVHPNYTSTYDDIGLVELKEAVSETSFIRMVCLHTPDDKPTNPKYFVTGWGYVNINKDTTDILLKAELAIVPKELCTERFQQINAFKNGQLAKGISDELVCAQDAKEIADACKGDSGGPLNLVFDPVRKRYRVFGIVSTGFSCGGSTPGLYTRVSNYLDYIEKIVWPTG